VVEIWRDVESPVLGKQQTRAARNFRKM